jgi:hypothetical protein
MLKSSTRVATPGVDAQLRHHGARAEAGARTCNDIDPRKTGDRTARRRRSDDPRAGRPALSELERAHMGR